MFYGAYEMGVYLFFLIGNKKYIIQDKKKNEESKYKVFMMVNTRKSKKQEGKKT